MARLLVALIQVKVTVRKFYKNSIKPLFLSCIAVIFLSSCAMMTKMNNSSIPSWYIEPQQNDDTNLYGVGQGSNLDEATKSALANAASRIIVSVSSQSKLLIEENRFDYQEQTQEKISQNIEKIDFSDFIVSRSKKREELFYVEIQIRKHPFITSQQDKINFLEKRTQNLYHNAQQANLIQKRLNLAQIIELYEEIELSARILKGVGQSVNLASKLTKLAQFKHELNTLNHEIEFYFEPAPKEIAKIIKNALNHKGFPVRKEKNAKQVVLRINESKSQNTVYEAHIVKLRVDFENSLNQQIIAGNSVEVTGSSAINYDEAYRSALKALEEKISREGVLKIIGIINAK